MFVVAAQYYAKQGLEDEIAAILQKMIAISSAEPGCALYTVNRSIDDPRKFLLIRAVSRPFGLRCSHGDGALQGEHSRESRSDAGIPCARLL